MMPRTDGRPYDLEAIIISQRCASCGICIGSCSFNAVNFPEKTEKAILQEIKNSIAAVKGSKEPVIVGIFCSYSASLKKVVDPVTHAVRGFPHVGIITVPCIGMFNTSWIEYAFNSGGDGLFLCGCQINDCHYRFGNKWLEERLLGRRLPILRQTADRSLLRVFWHSELDVDKLLNEIAEFTEDIKNKRQKRFLPEEASMKKSQWALASIALSIPAALVFYLSDAGHIFSNPEDSLAKLSIKHSGKRLVECDDFALLAKEAEKYREALKETGMAQMELKQLGNCTRERHPVYMEVYIDNDRRLAKSYAPNGWKKDGASFIYEKFVLKPTIHKVLIKMRDTADGNRFDYTFEESIDFKKGYSTVIDFDENNKKFFLR
ncbi:MAG: hypothetical protein A2056_05830 [Deltaproteobacteria bacterium GWA2_42_85]|nr:MAG: hypothetical protein A2056_05830 [Deltaproteobacteria bacterium GWA2_42_85]